MNDSLDLRNRILKMRENNNLNVTTKESLNNNLMSEFESSIKDGAQKELNSAKDNASRIVKNNSENHVELSDKTENKDINKIINNNDAQFLMLANKFNEAVEVILELSHKVEKLEKYASQKSSTQKNNVRSSTFFNFKIFVFLLLIPVIILGFFTLPIDIILIKSILIDILSSI